MGSCSAGGSSGERLCILADHKVIPQFRIEAMKYWYWLFVSSEQNVNIVQGIILVIAFTYGSAI